MSQHMRFDEESELSGYRASPWYQEPRFAYNDQFEGTRADKLTPLDRSSLRSVRLLGLSYLALGLLILGFLLTLGEYLTMQITLTSLYVIIASVLIFIGFWLLLRKRKRTAPRD
jgi:hypothetical protein